DCQALESEWIRDTGGGVSDHVVAQVELLLVRIRTQQACEPGRVAGGACEQLLSRTSRRGGGGLAVRRGRRHQLLGCCNGDVLEVDQTTGRVTRTLGETSREVGGAPAVHRVLVELTSAVGRRVGDVDAAAAQDVPERRVAELAAGVQFLPFGRRNLAAVLE